MRLLYIYLVVTLSVARGRSNKSTVTGRSDSFEVTRDGGGLHNNTDKPSDSALKDADLRRHKKAKHIWMWDLYCRLQSAKGDCKDHMTRYYYNSDFDECHHFNYSGCNGNQNNFESHAECEQRCKGVNFLNLKEHSLPTVCHLQPDSGLCLAFIKSYYYQVDSGKCLEFTYGGCGGNLNRFATKASCEEYCSTTSDTSTETTLKPSARIDHTNIDDE